MAGSSMNLPADPRCPLDHIWGQQSWTGGSSGVHDRVGDQEAWAGGEGFTGCNTC